MSRLIILLLNRIRIHHSNVMLASGNGDSQCIVVVILIAYQKALTCCGGMSLTVSPQRSISRAHSCAVAHASIATIQLGMLLKNDSTAALLSIFFLINFPCSLQHAA